MNTELEKLIERLYSADDCDQFDSELADHIVSLYPAQSRAWAARARAYYKLDDAEVAGACVREAVARDPQCPDAAWMAACLADDEGDTQRALALLEDALVRNPNHYGCLLVRGWISHEKNGDDEQALHFLRLACLARPDRLRAFNNLQSILLEQGRIEEAISVYRQITALVPSNGMHEYNLGSSLHVVEAYARAIEFLDLARILLGPQNAIQHNRAMCLEDLERYQEAIDEWSHLLQREPDWNWPREGRARCLRKLGRIDEALSDIRVLYEQDPHNEDGRWLEAEILYDRKQYAQAVTLLDALVDDGFGDQWKLNLRGACYSELQQYDKAKPDLLRALAQDGKYFSARSTLAEVELALGNFEAALEHVDIAIAQSPDNWHPHEYRAKALVGLGRESDALREYERWLAQHPDAAFATSARLECAGLLRALQRWQEALAHYQVLFRDNPNNGFVAWCIGMCLKGQGQVANARPWYKKAESIYRLNGNAQYAQACQDEHDAMAEPKGFFARWFGRR